MRSWSHEVIQLSVKLIFHRVKGWSIDWDNCHEVVMKLSWGRVMWRDIRWSSMTLGRILWACTRDVLTAKPTLYIWHSEASFPFQMEYPDPTLSILPPSNILVSPRAATSMLKCASSLQMWVVLHSGLVPFWRSSNILYTKSQDRVVEIIERFWTTT